MKDLDSVFSGTQGIQKALLCFSFLCCMLTLGSPFASKAHAKQGTCSKLAKAGASAARAPSLLWLLLRIPSWWLIQRETKVNPTIKL